MSGGCSLSRYFPLTGGREIISFWLLIPFLTADYLCILPAVVVHGGTIFGSGLCPLFFMPAHHTEKFAGTMLSSHKNEDLLLE